ncbi:hypothetical protein [Clostridium kluyveri]|nr:hypothetical protein [Clostridium kluyveri]
MIDRWKIFNYLKGGNNKITVKDIEKAQAEEVKEGLIEFILLKEREKR